MAANEYTYESAGFSPFLDRSIDSDATLTLATAQPAPVRQIQYDQTQQTGAMGDYIRIGKILVDGRNGRISVLDDNGNETTRIGDLGE